jgi:hypothetical protein
MACGQVAGVYQGRGNEQENSGNLISGLQVGGMEMELEDAQRVGLMQRYVGWLHGKGELFGSSGSRNSNSRGPRQEAPALHRGSAADGPIRGQAVSAFFQLRA